jgi:serine phosphatase RsbU (regulator of sigma subunit)
MASVYINMGRIFKITGDYKTAKGYYEKGIRLSKLLGNTDYVAYGNNNLGIVYLKEGKEIRKALHYFLEALKIEMASGDSLPMTNAMTNIGNAYEELGMLDSAEFWQLKSLDLREILKDKQGISANLVNLSHLYLKRKEYNKALSYGEKGLNIALEMELPEYEFNAHLNIANALHALGKSKEAFEHLETYIAIKDSVQSDEDLRKLTEMNVSYQYERQQLSDSLARVEKEKIRELQHEEELHRRSIMLYSGLLIVALLFVLILFLVRGIRLKQKHNVLLAGKNELIQQQKSQVEEQKSLIEEKNREVTDSILYAKRLQQAILPPAENIRYYFPKSFLLYLPKDIVAGDFYFFETCVDKIIIGVADCTGHGVPGALVSVVCSNALSRIVRENRITDPGKILDEARILIVDTFSKSLEQVRDGMDISLLSIDLKTHQASWAGANNPLWIQRQNGQWEELSPDKQPVGLYEFQTPFTTHQFPIEKGDRLYLFSDGYSDQFGGESGKKMKPSGLRNCLQSTRDSGIHETEKSLQNQFTQWKGVLEQIDDVCVLGLEIP